jgi:hypothetical protein
MKAGILLLAILLFAGCSEAEGGEASADHQPVHVDSIFPIEEEIRRFRQTLGPEPAGLGDGAGSLEGLIGAFADAVERADTGALQRMVLSRDEFGYLYYPSTHYTTRPYELGPAIVWFQLENYGSRGFSRLLRRYGGRPLGMSGYRCEEEPLIQGENRIWRDCLVQVRGPDGTRDLSLFGAILEREGAFKFVSYANRISGS